MKPIVITSNKGASPMTNKIFKNRGDLIYEKQYICNTRQP